MADAAAVGKVAELAGKLAEAEKDLGIAKRWFGTSQSAAAAEQVAAAEVNLAEAQGLLAAAETEAGVSAAEAIAIREAGKQAVKQGVTRGLLTGIAEWTGLELATLLIVGSLVTLTVIGIVIEIKLHSSPSQTSAAGPTDSTSGGGSKPGELAFLGKLDISKFGKLFKSLSTPNNNVYLYLPQAGGDVGDGSRVHIRFDNFPYGTFIYNLGAGALCGFAGAATGGATDCGDDNVPREYRNCKADFDITFKLMGVFDDAGGMMSGTGTGTTGIADPNLLSPDCPQDVKNEATKGSRQSNIAWQAKYDGKKVDGSIDLGGPLPFTAYPS